MKKLMVAFLFGIVLTPFALAEDKYVPMDEAVVIGLEGLKDIGEEIHPGDRAFAEYWPSRKVWFVGFERCVDELVDGQNHLSCYTKVVQVYQDRSTFYVPRH